VYRWETELALAKADFNEAEVQLKTAKFNLNQTLNRPVNEEFIMDDPSTYENIQQVLDGRIVSILENPGSLQLLADFLTQEAMINLPEIQQIELALEAQERLLKSNKRALYTPSLVLAANYDYPISIVNPGEPIPIPGLEISSGPTWNAAVVASIPLFNGGSRRYQKQKTQIELYQLQDERKDLGNKLEFQIRTSLEKVHTSYRNYLLNRHAAESAQKNVDIVQDLYNEGLVSIVNLIDAQNAYLGAEINASNSLFQFIVDLFTMERYTGQYLSLATEEQRTAFLQRFIQSTMNGQ
jgi:outer membrane protein TolC